MTIDEALVITLGPLVDGRAMPNRFEQHTTWPAIRYQFISTAFNTDICGDGGDEVADHRVQVDGVAKTYVEMRALRTEILAAMSAFDPPATAQGGFEDYDAEAKCHRISLDFLIQPSAEVSP